MSEPYELGSQFRRFMSGFLGEAPPAAGWGRRIEAGRLEHLYAPQEVVEHRVPPGGIDNLGLESHDVFVMPGRGEFAVDFSGYFQVAREAPTSPNWADAEVYVNLTDIRLTGHDDRLGQINVRINPQLVSAGQTFPPGTATDSSKCRIAAGVTFEAPDTGITLFNREPILLMNDAIDSIPPVEDPNGAAHIYRLPLYDMAQPNGRPVAYLTELRYTVGNYLTAAQAEEIRGRI